MSTRAVVGVGTGGPAGRAHGGGHRDGDRTAHQVRIVRVGVRQALGGIRRVVGMNHLVYHQVRVIGRGT